MTTPTEYTLVERPILDTLTGQYGYRYIHPDEHPSLRSRENEVLFRPLLIEALVRINGIPRDAAEAADMSRQRAGRTHPGHTGLALVALPSGAEAVGLSTTDVRFGPMDEDEIRWYAETGEGADKAGAYAVQGLAALFIQAVQGSPSNVIGLPVELLYRLSADLGVDLKLFSGPQPVA